MKTVLRAIALTAIGLAGPALAQSAAPAAGTPATTTDAAPKPHHPHNNMHKKAPAGASSDEYSGVDTAGKKEEVKAPYGGKNQAQADKKEAPVTDRLNEMQLKGNGQM